jgi:hypothetical protein
MAIILFIFLRHLPGIIFRVVTKKDGDFRFQGLIQFPGFNPVIVANVVFILGVSLSPFYALPDGQTIIRDKDGEIIGIINKDSD